MRTYVIDSEGKDSVEIMEEWFQFQEDMEVYLPSSDSTETTVNQAKTKKVKKVVYYIHRAGKNADIVQHVYL